MTTKVIVNRVLVKSLSVVLALLLEMFNMIVVTNKVYILMKVQRVK